MNRSDVLIAEEQKNSRTTATEAIGNIKKKPVWIYSYRFFYEKNEVGNEPNKNYPNYKNASAQQKIFFASIKFHYNVVILWKLK